jgi:cytoskeletal protein RodZ
MEPNNQPKQAVRRSRKVNLRKLGSTNIILIILVLAIAVLGWLYYDTSKENKKLSNPQAVAQQEAERLKAEVGQLVELPDERPTIATVSDVTKLQSQQFFAKAQNGDKVLIFTNAKRAVLYRPSTHKVIEYAPVNIGNQ